MDKKEFIKELESWIPNNSWLSSNGDYVVSTKWLKKFINEHK